MKLRLKLSTQPSAVPIRVEAAGTCTVEDLKLHALQAIACLDGADPGSLNLSLNKKDTLSASETLASLGLCSGDTVWVMVAGDLPAPPDNPASATASAGMPSSSSAALPAGPAAAAAVAAMPMEVEQQPQMQSPAGADDQPPCPSDGKEEETMGVLDEALVVQTIRMSHHLRRVLASTDQRATASASTAEPQQQQQQQPSAHVLLLAVVHAVMLETGFEVQQQTPQLDLFSAPSSWKASYCWPSSSSSSSAAAAGLEVRISASRMGPFLALHGAVATPSPAPYVPSSSSGTASRPAKTLNLDTRLYTTTTAATASTSPSSSSSSFYQESFSDLPRLWVLLKDQVALWLLHRAFQEAGLPPPLGLLTLPLEIKDLLVSLLTAQELATIAAVCSELRHLASADELWQPLFEKEFGAQRSAADAAAVARSSWRGAFASRWRQRVEQQRRHAQEQAEWQQRQELMRRQQWAPPFRGPHYPAPHPPGMPPGIIGGDYDRIGLGGMGGGMLPLGQGGSFGMGGMGGVGGGLGMPPGPLGLGGPGFGRMGGMGGGFGGGARGGFGGGPGMPGRGGSGHRGDAGSHQH